MVSVELTTLRIFPSPQRRRHVLTLLRSVQRFLLATSGCRCCRICQEDGSENAILYIECWESEPAFEQHLRSELYRRVLEAMELSSHAPELLYHHIAASKGIERLGALRGAVGQPVSNNR